MNMTAIYSIVGDNFLEFTNNSSLSLIKMQLSSHTLLTIAFATASVKAECYSGDVFWTDTQAARQHILNMCQVSFLDPVTNLHVYPGNGHSNSRNSFTNDV